MHVSVCSFVLLKCDCKFVRMEQINDTLEHEMDNFQVIGKAKKAKTTKVKPSLVRWMRSSVQFEGDIEHNSCPVKDVATVIEPVLLQNLSTNNIVNLFPVQNLIIPRLMDSLNNLKFCQPRDICVLSPTGSGKTLAYAIPIVNHLMRRVVTQIRALVILPVSDLANQVFKVFQTLCKGTTLRVGLATGSIKGHSNVCSFFRPNLDGIGNRCLVDILVATPGKLMDLIQSEQNTFNLKHLELLVIDEADRMMNETQFQWLSEIEQSVFSCDSRQYCLCRTSLDSKHSNDGSIHMDALSVCSTRHARSLFKILFSATLTIDPEKIDHLSLYHPKLYSMSLTNEHSTLQDPKQIIPANLKEQMIITDRDKKPLVLWYLVKTLNYRHCLCFTDSVSSTHRLYQLMQQLPDIVVKEYSSKQSFQKRSKILSQFESGLIDVIITTDIFSRGLDVNGISYVLCYDPPRNDTAYIHRIGRTARAGKQGTALSLITPDQLKHFTIVTRRAHRAEKGHHIERLAVKKSDLKPFIGQYREALKILQKDVQLEHKSSLIKQRKEIFKSIFSQARMKMAPKETRETKTKPNQQ